MTVVVFAGPTLSRGEILKEMDADVRPPAARGDVIRAALTRPDAIAIIDGYFDRVASVWHKEILWAMAEGIHVFGASSMGALRAAELAAFGMEGVGAVFDAYLREELTDDDEVAVVHAAEEHGYRALSEAMVNIRATLRAAVEAGVIGAGSKTLLEIAAKGLTYPERNYQRVVALGRTAGVSDTETKNLEDWLAAGRIDQKREDAQRLLRRLRDMAHAGWKRKVANYAFARTDAWNGLLSRVRAETDEKRTLAGRALDVGVSEELLVLGRAGLALEGALARALSLEEAKRALTEIDARAIEQVADDFRRERGLLEAADFEEWLTRHSMGEDEIVPFFRREATIRRVRLAFGLDTHLHLNDQLRATGDFAAVRERATHKRAVLSALGLNTPELHHTGLSEAELWRWYFENRLHTKAPDSIVAHATNEHAGLEQLRSAVIREYCYVAAIGGESSALHAATVPRHREAKT